MKNDNCQSDLSDLAVIHGFSQLPHLRYVEMCSMVSFLRYSAFVCNTGIFFQMVLTRIDFGLL